jgi:anaerobic selenocysteine-containing dehydrogenase
MTQQSRRKFLKTTAIGSATVALGASGCSASELTSKNAMDHVVVVLFEIDPLTIFWVISTRQVKFPNSKV